MTQKDKIYSNPDQQITPFEFNEQVAHVFSDMINRSVPGYQNCIAMLSVLAREYAQVDSSIYDLGCSLGAGLLALNSGLQSSGCQLIGVDNSAAMLSRCEAIFREHTTEKNVQLRQENIQDTVIENASIVVMNFTLQFIPIEDRGALIEKIYSGLNPDGVLILSEKILPEHNEQKLWKQLHEQFKRLHGYGELEISGKRTALENVLIPESTQTHLERLTRVGFKSVRTWYQCLNFSSFLAIK